MTPAARVKGIVGGLAGIALGAATITWAVVGMRGRSDPPAACATPSDCEAGCAKGRGPDCRQAGLMHLQGFGVEPSPARAHPLLRAACDAGDAPGCTALGALLVEAGGALAVAPSEALAIFAKACDGGDAMGCNNLANLYDEAGPQQDRPRARALYEKACNRGSGMACSTLAKRFQAGDGVPADPVHATTLFSRSLTILQTECDSGSARACGQAGWLHERGLGGDQDAAKALRDYQSGCNDNDGASCFNLALTLRATNAADPTAAGLVAKACKLGLPQACAPAAD
jgi:TPR repeat protein